MIQHLVDYVAIAVLAASGSVVGVRKGFDLFGIATLAVLTGVGGGVLRDLLLDLDPPPRCSTGRRSPSAWPCRC